MINAPFKSKSIGKLGPSAILAELVTEKDRIEEMFVCVKFKGKGESAGDVGILKTDMVATDLIVLGYVIAQSINREVQT